MTKTITPHLWFDKNAADAVTFYISLFEDSCLNNHTVLTGTPSGDVDVLNFKLWGSPFMAINAGPLFKFNQSISFFVYCGSEEKIDLLYNKLCEGGTVMMPLDKYDWTTKYAWVQDKFGISWQLDVDEIKSDQKIVPALMFANEKRELVKEAIDHYTAVFPGSRILMEYAYPPTFNMPAGTLMFSQVKLSGYIMNVMSSHMKHDFDFNEAISMVVTCKDQKELDHYWNRLTEGGQEQPCGWLKDRYGVSWQIVPRDMEEMMTAGNKEALSRATQVMLKMKKFDIEALQKAYRGPA